MEIFLENGYCERVLGRLRYWRRRGVVVLGVVGIRFVVLEYIFVVVVDVAEPVRVFLAGDTPIPLHVMVPSC